MLFHCQALISVERISATAPTKHDKSRQMAQHCTILAYQVTVIQKALERTYWPNTEQKNIKLKEKV